ncbi:hypothetical protein EFA46_002255 [Halarchaeum sp. CBA1220]|uniref:Uncharacterized protein n=1 Tax=Halarchaeum grantii TaxID=1193105 RepID=A0A830ETB1_9EURY|nr:MULTISPECIES: hypothetical protein [Halarchaeum]QLC33078.1 hypothetical protein EFA46_002255 [Halarchaeum sp. CBA1220]GGL27629.1 hypothetical protein GCM10009037_09040 [Halarchaeum grantii]
MTDTPIETIRTMLESLLEETDDPDVHYKLRTSLQLLTILEERDAAGRDALEHTDLDPEVAERLERLGYID